MMPAKAGASWTLGAAACCLGVAVLATPVNAWGQLEGGTGATEVTVMLEAADAPPALTADPALSPSPGTTERNLDQTGGTLGPGVGAGVIALAAAGALRCRRAVKRRAP